jgi:hypothetical protein
MRNALLLAFICVVIPVKAAPPAECNFREFPDFWADAQSRVEKLHTLLKESERANTYSQASAKPFRQSLAVCASKRKSIWNDPSAGSGNGGVGTQMKCEAFLICSRLAILEMP